MAKRDTIDVTGRANRLIKTVQTLLAQNTDRNHDIIFDLLLEMSHVIDDISRRERGEG
jgi:hypothetical protein